MKSGKAGGGKGGINLPADSNGPIASALALRDIFKTYGGEYGTIHAQVALARMNADEVAALGRDLIASQADNPGYGYHLEITTAFSRWAELDPEGALQAALGTQQKSAQSRALLAVFAALAKTDPELARQKVDALQDPGLKRSAQMASLQAIAARDPDAWLSWVKADPSMASEWSMGTIVSEWALDDPAATAARLKSMPAKLLKGSVESLGKVWAAEDPAAARAWAESLEDPGQRSRALGAVVSGMAAKDPDAALAAAAALPPDMKGKALAGIFQTLGDLDFDSAIDRLAGLSDPKERQMALQQLSNSDGWTSIEPSKLLGLLEGLPKGNARSRILSQIGSEFAQSAPADIDRVLKEFSPADQLVVRRQIVESMSYQNPARAIELMEGMPDSEQKNDMMRQAISYLGRNDPQEAIKRIDQLPEGQRESTISSLASYWVQSDAPAAVKWMESLSGKEHASAIQSMIPGLVQENPEQAVRLYDKLAGAQDLDQNDGRLTNTAVNLVANWSNRDPAAALKWASGLEHESARNQALSYAVQTWKRTDPAAARQAVEQLNMSAEFRNNLLQQFKQPEVEQDFQFEDGE